MISDQVLAPVPAGRAAAAAAELLARVRGELAHVPGVARPV
jgi:hypothetical protein